MKFFSHNSKPSYERIRLKVNGRQKNRTVLTVSRDTKLYLEDDCVRLTYKFYTTSSEHTIITYYPDYMELTIPRSLGGERTSLLHRLATALGEFTLYPTVIWKGPHKNRVGISTTSRKYMWRATRYDNRSDIVKYGLAAIPLVPGRPTRIGYDGSDLDEARLATEEQQKIHDTWSKRSLRAAERAEVLGWLGFGATFWLDGYPVPPKLTIENAKHLNSLANAMGYSCVERAWQDGVFVGDQLTPQDMEMFGEGLATMFVDFHKKKKEK